MATDSRKVSDAPPDNLAPGADSAESATLQKVVGRVRSLMIISALTTAIAIAAVLGVVGYRVFRAGEGGARSIAEGIVALPKGARLVATAVSGNLIVVTLDVGGSSEIRIFDVNTLRQTGRLRFATEP